MDRKSRKETSYDVDSSLTNKHILKKLLKEDQIIVERIKELVNILRAKYNISKKDIIHLTDDKEILIPISIFNKKLRILETLTKYLKEELNFSYHQIGVLLNRNERNLWNTYKSANRKYSDKLKIEDSRYFVPISTFQNKLGALENIVLYLKDELGLSYHIIGELLERDERTIWSAYNKTKKKIKDEK